MKRIFLYFVFSVFAFQDSAQTTRDIDSLARILPMQQDSAKVNTLIKIGSLYNMKGMSDSALRYDKLAIKFAEKSGTQEQICAVLLSLGETEGRLSKYDEALEHLFMILKSAQNNGCGKYASKAKPVIGFIYLWQKKEKEALHYLLEAEVELKKWRDTSGLIAAYGTLPVCLALNGDTVKAMQYFKKAFDLVDSYVKTDTSSSSRKEFSIHKKLAFTYNMINFLVKKEDLNIALAAIKKLQTEVQAGKNKYQQFTVLCIMANVLFRLEDYKNAQYSGEQAIKLYDGGSNYSELRDVYFIVAAASANLKQYEKAYNNLNIYRKYNDSAYKFSKIEAVNAVEVKYEVKKKEDEINTLNKEKKGQIIITWLTIGSLIVALGLLIFMIRSKRLQKKLFAKEKEIQKKELEQKMFGLQQTALRAQMNPHFIFNCLNSVQRYIINNDAEGGNHYLTTFASLIRQTLENSGKELIPLKDEIQYLETYIKMEQLRSSNRFDYKINISAGVDESDTYVPNMIIQPFIENSILHGMLNKTGEKSMLSLDISLTNKLTCVVDDNGSGIKSADRLQANVEKSHTSMGSSITEKRITMYNSLHEDKIELEVIDKSDIDGPGHGTKIILKFPLNN